MAPSYSLPARPTTVTVSYPATYLDLLSVTRARGSTPVQAEVAIWSGDDLQVKTVTLVPSLIESLDTLVGTTLTHASACMFLDIMGLWAGVPNRSLQALHRGLQMESFRSLLQSLRAITQAQERARIWQDQSSPSAEPPAHPAPKISPELHQVLQTARVGLARLKRMEISTEDLATAQARLRPVNPLYPYYQRVADGQVHLELSGITVQAGLDISPGTLREQMIPGIRFEEIQLDGHDAWSFLYSGQRYLVYPYMRRQYLREWSRLHQRG